MEFNSCSQIHNHLFSVLCLTSGKRSLEIHLGKKTKKTWFCFGLFMFVMVRLNRHPHNKAACYNPNKSTPRRVSLFKRAVVVDCFFFLFFSAVVSGVLISIGTAECSSGLSRHLQLDRNKTMTARRKIFGL